MPLRCLRQPEPGISKGGMIVPALLVLVNVVLSYVIGFLGRNRKMGFWGHFFASLLLTPIIGFLLIIATDPVKDQDEVKSLKNEIKSLKAKLSEKETE